MTLTTPRKVPGKIGKFAMHNDIYFRTAMPTDWSQMSALLTNAQLPPDGAKEPFMKKARDDV